MTYVPVIVPSETASPRVRDLSERLKVTIDQYRHEHPELSGSDVQQALALVRASSGMKSGAVIAIAIGLGLLALLGGLILYWNV